MNMLSALRNTLALLMLLALPAAAAAQDAAKNAQRQQAEQAAEQLEKPLYSPFIERYVLDELKSLRTELLTTRAEFVDQFSQRQLKLADHAVTYSTDTVTYFFYLVAGASSLLLLVGWTSIRDIKEKALAMTDQEVTKLVARYEKRLSSVEKQLSLKEQAITENKDALEKTNEIHSLWLRASQEVTVESKIQIYDQILKLRPDDVEALTYKADAVLELDEPLWATNLCTQALTIDDQNGHAFYQLACASACLKQLDEAQAQLEKAAAINPSYIDSAQQDPLLRPLRESGQLARLSQQLHPKADDS